MGFLEKGTDPTMRDENGLTSFHYQVATTRKKDFEILDLILENEEVDITTVANLD